MARNQFWIAAGVAGWLAVAGVARAQDGTEVDPLLEVAADMNAAALRSAKLHTDKPTQTSQKNALKKLDDIIARLEEQERQRGTGNGRSKRPAPDSRIMTGPGGMGTLHAENRQGKQWGDLPPKERERILQSMNDGFPSSYQKILERYFARLADEKPLPETPAADGETSAEDDAPADGVKPAASADTKAETKPDAPAETKDAK